MTGDLAESERVGLGRHLRALQLCARGHEAVQKPGLLDVNDVGHELDAAVVGRRVALVAELDRTGLVADVAV